MNVQEWLAKQHKSFTLKSGLDVVVRPLAPFRLMELGPIPKMEATEGEEYAHALKRIALAGLVSPKYGTNVGAGELNILDLSMDDANEITEAVMGITKRTEGAIPLDDTASKEGSPSS
jgi:hypothetical protein